MVNTFLHTVVSHVNKEGLISTNQNKLFILLSFCILTLVGYVSLILDMIVKLEAFST